MDGDGLPNERHIEKPKYKNLILKHIFKAGGPSDIFSKWRAVMQSGIETKNIQVTSFQDKTRSITTHYEGCMAASWSAPTHPRDAGDETIELVNCHVNWQSSGPNNQ